MSSLNAPRITDWVVGRRRAPFYVADPAPGFRPDLLFCLDLGRTAVHAAEVIAPDTADEAAAWQLAGKMAAPLASSAPGRIRADTEGLASALRQVLPPTVTVVVGPTAELDAVAESFGDWSRRQERRLEPDYLEAGRVPEPDVRRFFEAAVRLYRAAPWTRIESDSQLVGLRAPWAGLADGCVSIIGTLGESRGIAVFESVEDFRQFARLADEVDPADGGRRRGPGVPMLAVHFDPAKSLPATMRAEVKEHRWPVAGSKAYPWLMRVDEDGVVRPLSGADYALAAAVADALVDLFEGHAALFALPHPEPVTLERRIEQDGATTELSLTAPCPGLDWHWLDETAVDAIRREDSEAILDDYLSTIRAGGATAEDEREVADLIDHLLQFKIEDANEPPLGWSAGLVEAFLLDYFPARVGFDVPAVSRTPERVEAFFAWLESEEYEHADVVDDIRARIHDVQPEFERRALDPSNYAPAKAVMLEMRREGVDPSDQEALSRFLDRFNERLRENPDLLPTPRARGRAASARVRWVPTPGQAPPAATDPCPCDSGRRYKKCCLRR